LPIGDEHALNHVAVVRLEQLYPWPEQELSAVFDQYAKAADVVWLQEEPENMVLGPSSTTNSTAPCARATSSRTWRVLNRRVRPPAHRSFTRRNRPASSSGRSGDRDQRREASTRRR
jgi:2-oxoglutarate dehydrogenase complex dehydrogenase (E1) component-like enzyme